MSQAMASPNAAYVVEYARPTRRWLWSAGFGAESTVTSVAADVFEMPALMGPPVAAPWELQDVLEWASTREDMPEYPDTEEATAERTDFLVAISAALLESIERRSA